MTNDLDSDDELPEHLRKRPEQIRDWPLPTAWLLGTKLLGSMRDMLLSSVVKVDLRTWMTASEVVDRTGDVISANGEEACYIDFLADTGDSQRLVYQLARLLKQEKLAVKSWEQGTETETVLPRGSMLVIGGDIAYPVSTHRRLLDRIRAPFKWAHDELPRDERARLEEKPVTLLAVPGNHDYYDGLRGFEAMFHAPPVHPFGPSSTQRSPSEQPLRMPGYKVAQHASYFAAALPFGWRLWGLDIENDEVDDRQAAFFEWSKSWTHGAAQQPDPAKQSDRAIAVPPDALIVVTSRPAFVYQGPSDHSKVIKTSMKRLGLTPAFDDNGQLRNTQVRLDLSGDVHLYERYWGADAEAMPDDLDRVAMLKKEKKHRAEMATYEPPERYGQQGSKTKVKRGNDDTKRNAPDVRFNYASVVSGLGGTFHHPSQVRLGTTPPRATWPSAEHSAREIGIRLANPVQMFRAGAVGIVGLAVALACYFLIWRGELADAKVNVLDVPFALTSSLSAAQTDALRQLGLVAAMVGLVIVMMLLPVGAYYLGRDLSTPIREMRTPTCLWPRITKALTHNGPIHALLRLLGANTRSSWMFLTNTIPLAATLVGWWFLYGWVRELEAQAKDFIAVYSIITLVVVAMAALGVFRAGQKMELESWPSNILRRVLYLCFGVAIAFLVIWTPYAWVRLVCRNHLMGSIGVGVIILTMLVQFGRTIFRRGLWTRRVMTALGFLLLVAGALVFPLCFARMDGTAVTNSHAAISLALSALFGAYFACLWVGWYFCICLQWNAHGNEAGGAARITDYGQFLRIKLTENKAEVWAIAVEEAVDTQPRWYVRWFRRKATLVEAAPSARVIDHFTVERRPPLGDSAAGVTW